MKVCPWAAVVLLWAQVGCVDRGVSAASADAAWGGGGGAPLGGCEEGPVPPGAADHELAYVGFSVSERRLLIAPGEVVEWSNRDAVGHTVTAGAPGADPAWAEFHGVLAPGARWAYRFCAAGDRIYFCKPHEASMFDYHVVVR